MARLSRILGPDGQPVDLSAREPVAGPTRNGVRSPLSGHPADGLTPARLAAIHRAAAAGDTLRYYELAEDIEERDAHYAAVLGSRKRQVAQLPVTVEAAGDDAESIRHADHVRGWLGDDVLALALPDMLDAIGKGISITEIEWDTSDGVRPARLTWRPPQWFEVDDLSFDDPMLRQPGGNEPLEDHRFVVHRHRAKSGLTVRSGIARVASWGWMYKAFTLRDWALFTEHYGLPVPVGKYGSSASEEERDVLWRAVSGLAGAGAAIFHESMQIDYVETKNTADGSALYQGRADWIDRQISKLVLGQTATTDAAPGSHAIGGTHRAVQEDLERHDAMLLAASLNRQVVQRMVAYTYGPQRRYPRLRIGRPDEVPIAVVVEAVAKLGPLGLTVEASQIRDRLGVTEAAAGAELIGGRQAVPGAAGGAAPADPLPALQQRVRRTMPLVGHLVSLHARDGDAVARMTDRLAGDAAGALEGLTDDVREAIAGAGSLDEAAQRLTDLGLDPAALRQAIARAMALADLIGRAAVLDELGGAG